MPPSQTAAGVARARTLLTRPATSEGDQHAERRLSEDIGGDFPSAPGPMFHHIVARTRFFDAVTLDAVERGTRQVVIVGAGYDCRALRFRHTGVRYYELDQIETQADKRERLTRLGIAIDDIAYVAIDLAETDVDRALVAAGHQADQTSLFVCEGLIVYLELPVVERLFRGLRNRVAGDATLAVSVSRRDRVVADPGGAVRRALLRRRLARMGEPWRTSLDGSGWSALLEATGWNPIAAVDPHDLDAEAPSGGSQLITAKPAARS